MEPGEFLTHTYPYSEVAEVAVFIGRVVCGVAVLLHITHDPPNVISEPFISSGGWVNFGNGPELSFGSLFKSSERRTAQQTITLLT